MGDGNGMGSYKAGGIRQPDEPLRTHSQDFTRKGVDKSVRHVSIHS